MARSSSIFRTKTSPDGYVVASEVVFAMPYAYLKKERCIRQMKPSAAKRVIPMHLDRNLFPVDELRAKAMLASRCLFTRRTLPFDKANVAT